MNTLKISDDVVERIQQEASAKGLSVDDYLRRLLPAEPQPFTPAQRAEAWDEWVETFGVFTGPLSDEAISRDSIYTREDEML